jgi:hypothetical protein
MIFSVLLILATFIHIIGLSDIENMQLLSMNIGRKRLP